ncbi:MAG TPA: CAP domain-containing protein [Sulfurovum sp.]
MKITSFVLISAAFLIFTGCGSGKVAHATIINTDKTYTSQLNSKSVNKKLAHTYPSITKAQQKEFLTKVNQVRSERRTCGKYGSMGPVAPLVWSDKLYEAAYTHSYDMAKSSHFSHNGSGTANDRTAVDMRLGRGSSLKDRMSYADYRWLAVGENIAAGQHSAQAAMDAWLRSDEHCKNLMSGQFTEVGMAYTTTNDRFKTYWSQNFGRSM